MDKGDQDNAQDVPAEDIHRLKLAAEQGERASQDRSYVEAVDDGRQDDRRTVHDHIVNTSLEPAGQGQGKMEEHGRSQRIDDMEDKSGDIGHRPGAHPVEISADDHVTGKDDHRPEEDLGQDIPGLEEENTASPTARLIRPMIQ